MIEILTYIVATLSTYGFGLLSKKKGWNEIVPIPVQNIIVGIIVFLISSIIYRLTNQNMAIEELAKQIVVSLGGSGTATLYYDNTKIKGE